MHRFLSSIAAQLLAIFERLRSFPAWARAQRLSQLKAASDGDPTNADKHAAYLAELGRQNPVEVLVRVEGRQYGSNAAVAVEYLKALVASGRVRGNQRHLIPRP